MHMTIEDALALVRIFDGPPLGNAQAEKWRRAAQTLAAAYLASKGAKK